MSLTKVYVDKETVTLNPNDVVGGNVTVTVLVSADEDGAYPVTENVTFAIEQEPVSATSDGNGSYTLVLSEAQAKAGATIVVGAGDGVETASFTLVFDELSEQEEQTLLANVMAYMPLNGNFAVYGTADTNAFIRRERDASTQFNDNKTYNFNLYKRGLTLDGIALGARNDHSEADNWGSFSISMMINGKDVYNSYQSGYGYPIFTTDRTDGDLGLGFYVRGAKDDNQASGYASAPTRFYFKVGGTNTQVDSETVGYFNHFKDNGLQQWTITVDRTVSGKLTIKVYIDAVQIFSKEVAVADTFDLGNGMDKIGFGAAAFIDDTANYPADSNKNGNKNTNIEADNILVYNGLMTENEMRLVDCYYDEIAVASNYNFSVASAYIDAAGKANVVITGTDGVNLTGATFSGLTAGEPIVSGNSATYEVTVPTASLEDYLYGKEVDVTLNGRTKKVVLNSWTGANDTVVIDGVMDEEAYSNVIPYAYTHTRGSDAAANTVTVSTKTVFGSDHLYLGLDVEDAHPNADRGFEFRVTFFNKVGHEITKEFRLYVDGTVIIYDFDSVLAYNSWPWRTGSMDAYKSVTSAVKVETGVGYVIEVKLPWSIFGVKTAPDAVYLQPQNRLNDADGANGTVWMDGGTFGNWGGQVAGCYVRFDANGFAPTTIYGASNVTVTEGTNSGNTATLYYGYNSNNSTNYIRANDLTLEAEGISFTANGNGSYAFTVDEGSFVAGSTIPVTVKAANGTAIGSFNIVVNAAA